ncbi:MAG: SRPBCC family protein [Capsulimonas sp.]|uniref:SRPBCC family protein n=1 Tax=Capsulimonas sp. TaxID=2494211 RepID=UPI003263CDE4
MPRLQLITPIAAPIERVFDLARDIDVHSRTLADTGETAVTDGGSSLLTLGDTVTFYAVHFGVRQRLIAKITEFTPPRRFVDLMLEGAFASLTHTHDFEPAPSGTLMRDTIDYTAPLGPIGRLADFLFLKSYMTRLIERRNQALKEIAEANV